MRVAPAAPTGPSPLVFGAARRSGTTWLAGMLNAHPEVECRNEGWLFNELDGGASFCDWIDREKVARWAARREAQGTWLRHISANEAMMVMLRGAWEALVKEAVRREGWKDWSKLKWVGDKTTAYFCTQADAVHRLFPDARFIHMLRDGRDVIVSDMFLLLREEHYRDAPARVREEAHLAKEYHVHGKGKPVPLLQPHLARYLISEWARSVVGGLRARELYAERYYEIRYEAMIEDAEREVRRILGWLDVASNDDMVHHLRTLGKFENFSGGRKRGEADNSAEWRKGIVGDWRNYLRAEDKDLFKSVAGELLIELGYATDMNW